MSVTSTREKRSSRRLAHSRCAWPTGVGWLGLALTPTLALALALTLTLTLTLTLEVRLANRRELEGTQLLLAPLAVSALRQRRRVQAAAELAGHDVMDTAAALDPPLEEGGELAVIEVLMVHWRAAEARQGQLARVAHHHDVEEVAKGELRREGHLVGDETEARRLEMSSCEDQISSA